MPTIKLYHHGLTAGIPPMKNNHERAKRGQVTGWSASATRNNTRFLRSINPAHLNEHGYAFTLTLRDCPSTSDEWKTLRESFFKRLRRIDVVRFHWVTEWQRRGVPHLHGIAFFNNDYLHSAIIQHWIDLAGDYGAMQQGQHICDITDVTGWFQYLSKHASRGVKHYQRSSTNIPSGWQKTGRVWGYGGDWITNEPFKLTLTRPSFWVLRRIVRSWRIADARASKADVRSSRIITARRMLNCSDRHKSACRGISEWVSAENGLLIMEFLVAAGHDIDFGDIDLSQDIDAVE